jgi:hypothetical protein
MRRSYPGGNAPDLLARIFLERDAMPRSERWKTAGSGRKRVESREGSPPVGNDD